jgi:hypothetical protein
MCNAVMTIKVPSPKRNQNKVLNLKEEQIVSMGVNGVFQECEYFK